jgi:RNA polymerase sigma factor FliA
MDVSRAEIAELWRAYKEGGGSEARERLILHYAPLVKFVAARVGAGLPNHVEQCDLVSYGILGLIDAIDKFDPDLGFKFETYVPNRIRGAIFDELRLMDWAPRSIRTKHRAIENAASKLEAELCRSPDDEEMAFELGVTRSHLAKARRDISLVGVRALDEPLLARSDLDAGATLGDTIGGGEGDPVEEFDSLETSELLADAISRMPDRERRVLTLYYYEHLTLARIGEMLGVTESRVCQIHRKAILDLRHELTEQLPELQIVA